jgi:Mn-containing catalase
MLKQVAFPLTNTQMLNYFLDREYTTYFTFQTALNELESSGLIYSESTHNTSRYELTESGSETLSFFINNLTESITKDITDYLNENKMELRKESTIIADYYKSTNQDYVVKCEVKEGNATQFRLDISVPNDRQAKIICDNWTKDYQEIYAFVMNTLSHSKK